MTTLSTRSAHLRNWLVQQGLTDTAPLSDWLAQARERSLARDEYLLRAGEQHHFLCFIDSGLLRLFYVSPEGKERNKAFYTDNHLVGPVSAAISDGPAPFSIQALEASNVLLLPYQPFVAASATHPAVAQLNIRLLSNAFVRNEQREAMLLTCNAEQRYRWLLAQEPELPERLPQHHIASYLGVDAVSLSRLKRKLRAQDEYGQ
ncbi:Crp/Fnr family transcriptional regulator [Parahaliea mediterranea]|uniref:Crp/Fnr family transcriptional regulator n=1 Tax=Parahaliea mediterranea TaxID=651086 RepID=UPI00130085F5|nr:Crp/Fnr family transcriptional regulator [Parahaliea mediterranea]